MQKIICFIVTLRFEEIGGSLRERNFADFSSQSTILLFLEFFKNRKTLIHALRHIHALKLCVDGRMIQEVSYAVYKFLNKYK